MKAQIIKLMKSSFVYGVGNFLSQFINVLLLPIFTAYLTPRDYGAMSVLAFISFILVPLFSLGSGTSIGICYYDAKNKDKKNVIIWTAFVLLVFSSFIMAILGFLFSSKITHLIFNMQGYDYLFILNIFYVVFTILAIPFMLKLQFEEKQKIFSAITVISTLITIAISVLLVVYFKRGLNGMMEGYVLSKFISLMFYFRYATIAVNFNFELSSARDIINNGLPIVPSFLSLYVLQQGNNFILQKVNSLESAGIYSIGYNFGLGLVIIVGAFSTAWMPFFLSYSDRKEDAKKIIGRIMTYYVFAMGIISLLFYVFAEPIVLLLTKPNFHEAYKVIGFVATAQVLIGIFNILLPPIYYAKDVKYIAYIQIISSILFIGISLILTKTFGISGAAISLVVGYLIMDALLYFWNKQQKRRYLNIEYEWKRILPFAFCYISIVFIMLQKSHFSVPMDIVSRLLLLIANIVIVYYLLYSDERNFIANSIKSLFIKRKRIGI